MRTKREKHPWIADTDDPRYPEALDDFQDAETRAGESLGMLALAILFATLTLGVAVLF